MSVERNSPESPFVQTIIIDYYSQKEPPQLVQQLITNYYPHTTNSINTLSHQSESSSLRGSTSFVQDTHISGTPVREVGNLAWYMHCSKTEGNSRRRLAKGPDSLFGALANILPDIIEESTQSLADSSNSNLVSILLQN